MLEDLFHTCSHPTREQREILASNAGLELRSVTVWFQNKRQTERKVALGNATNLNETAPNATSNPSTSRLRRTKSQARLSRKSPSASSTGSVRSVHDLHRPRLAEGRTPSLDSIASRTERPQLPWQPQTPTRARTLSHPDLSNSSSTFKPHTPSRIRQLWEKMPSSPMSPESPKQDSGLDLAYLDYGHKSKSKKTLEWACAAARLNGKNRDDEVDVQMSGTDETQLARAFRFGGREDENPADDIVLDFDGDTEDEAEAHEAITPSSSQIIVSTLGSQNGRISESVDQEGNEEEDTDKMDIEGTKGGAHDEETVKAALVLCGLSGGTWH
ncbi:unnamed protein product [Somion occarium]